MIKFDAPKDVAISDFFENYVPDMFRKSTAGLDPLLLKGKNFILLFDVDGTKYGIKVTDGNQIEVAPGDIDGVNLTLITTEADWRANVTGEIEGVIERFIDPAELTVAGRYENAIKMQGTLKLKLTRDGAEPMGATIIFNGSAEPLINITIKMSDWVAMMRGEEQGQMLFMRGDMQVEGDMMLLMSLQSLI